MSDLSMTATEEKTLDTQIEKMMEWAKTRNVEAEQLALDSARLMAASTDRLDRLTKQPFFKRCWSRFNGDAASLEKATVNDVIQMQKMAFRYVNMLQEQQLLMANSLLTLKNNLNSLAVKEEETRKLIALLADRTRERFEKLENRVDQLEISTNLQGWLLGLDQRDYDEKFPTEYMRLLRVINDFYSLKKSGWNYNDLMFMRKAIQTVGLNPKEKVSLNKFIDKLTEEIQNSEVGIDAYTKAISAFKPEGMDNYSQFAIDNVSSPVYATLHGLKTHYEDKADAVEALQDSLSISAPDALKILLKNGIKAMNINLDYESTLAEIALEILGCMGLEEELLSEKPMTPAAHVSSKSNQADSTPHKPAPGEPSEEPSIKILKDLDAAGFMLDNLDVLNSKFGPYDRDKFFYNDGENSYGKLPDEARKIIMLTQAPINSKDIMAYLKDGSRGILMAMNPISNIESPILIFFDLSSNTFAIVDNELEKYKNDISKIGSTKWNMKDGDPKIDEKIQSLFDGIMGRISETMPAIK